MLPIKLQIPDSFLKPESFELIVRTQIKKIWAVELDLLAELDRVCSQQGIRYSLACGTLLGAARHGGFVPWDDDADVFMLREDYDRFCKIAPQCLSERYFLKTDFNSPAAARGHAQLHNSLTTAIARCEMQGDMPKYDFNQGMFVDVFPLDSVPADEEVCSNFLAKVSALKRRIYFLRTGLNAWRKRGMIKGDYPAKVIGFIVSVLQSVSRRDLLKDAIVRYEKLVTQYLNTAEEYVAPVSFDPQLSVKWKYRKCWFENLVRVRFATLELLTSKDFVHVLETTYGDWRQHVVGGAQHGGVLFDPEHPYTDYIGGLNRPCGK